jgi:hypothetical protein
MPASTLWSRAIFAFATAILGTWIFVWFIQRIQFKDVVMVPLVGIMFGNVIGGITNYLAYKYEMTQALSSWLLGHFSLVLKGRYEIVWLTVPLVMSQAERLTKLNAIAISQMEILTQDHRIEALEAHSEDLSPME